MPVRTLLPLSRKVPNPNMMNKTKAKQPGLKSTITCDCGTTGADVVELYVGITLDFTESSKSDSLFTASSSSPTPPSTTNVPNFWTFLTPHNPFFVAPTEPPTHPTTTTTNDQRTTRNHPVACGNFFFRCPISSRHGKDKNIVVLVVTREEHEKPKK